MHKQSRIHVYQIPPPPLTDGGGINPIAIIVAPIVALALLTAAAAIALAPVLINVNVGITVGRRKREIIPPIRKMIKRFEERFQYHRPERHTLESQF